MAAVTVFPVESVLKNDLPVYKKEALCLDPALQLLRQAGLALPSRRVVGRARWLQAVIDGLCALSSSDPLTGLVNRRHFEQALAREIGRVSRTGKPALMLMIDIDHFKQVNDTWGHAAGDLTLVAIAQTLQACIRPMDTLVRLGGEEFAVILPNCSPLSGKAIAERARQNARERRVTLGPGLEIGVTISIGGAFAQQGAGCTAASWIERADQQLYRAKSQGRDCSCIEGG